MVPGSGGAVNTNVRVPHPFTAGHPFVMLLMAWGNGQPGAGLGRTAASGSVLPESRSGKEERLRRRFTRTNSEKMRRPQLKRDVADIAMAMIGQAPAEMIWGTPTT